jgi:putative flippase GtrA
LKSAIVGGIGTFVNLGVMALLLWLTNIRDWRASAIASLAANVQNYLLNYFWTYPNRSQSGFQKLKDYLSYLMVSATGLVVTTVSYAALTWNLTHTSLLHIGPGAISPFTRLSCQFVAVFVGVCFNYASNKLFAWPYLVRVNLDASETASTPSLIELTERRRHKNVLDLDAEV